MRKSIRSDAGCRGRPPIARSAVDRVGAVFALAVGLVVLAGSFSCALGQQGDTAPRGLHYIYLIRHGWYDAADPRDPRVGKALDDLGRRQAKLTGARLAGLPNRPDRLISSTFTRAAQTADIIAKSLHMPVVRDSEVCECAAPNDRWPSRSPADAETCQVRLERAYARYVRPADSDRDERDVIVCHANVIRWLVTKSLGLPTARWPNYEVGNASITVLVVRPDGGTRLAAFSDTGHLPPSLQTWTGRGAGWSPPRPDGGWRGSRRDSTSRHPGIGAPAPPAAYDTLRHSTSGDR